MSFFTSKLPASFSAARKSFTNKKGDDDSKKKPPPIAGLDTGIFSTSAPDVFTSTVSKKEEEGGNGPGKGGGRSGGSKGSRSLVPGKNLTTLLHVGDVEGICGGEISTSGGERWCTKEECAWANHQEIKAELTSNTWYIKVPGNKQCFLTPSLPVDMVPDDAEDDVPLGDQFVSIEGWK